MNLFGPRHRRGGPLRLASSRSTAMSRKGNRPSFVDAAPPGEAEPLYERVREALSARGGVFGARMEVALVNDGPVTLLVEA